MQDILKEYGPALITVVAILALIALVTFLIGKDGGSVVGKAFSNLITDFFSKATGTVSSGQSTTTPASPQGIIMLMGGL
jgi:L-asparagine transporter-like permease